MKHGFPLLLAGTLAAIALAAGCSGGAGSNSAPSLAGSDGGPGRGTVHIMASPENPTTIHITGTGTFDSAGNYYEDGYEFPVIYKPIPQQSWVLTPWLSPSQTYLGYKALGYQLNATGPSPSPLPTDYENDKVETQLTTFALDTNVWEGFAVEFPSTAVPGVNLIVAQFWQGSPFSPPVSLNMMANDNYECEVGIRNNQTGGNPDATINWIDVGECTPSGVNGGTWHTFLFHIYADSNGNGIVQVWHNVPGTDPPTASYTGNVGYAAGQCVDINGSASQGCQNATPAPAPTAASVMTTYIGPYRPSDPNEAKMLFANIKFAYSEASADPTQP
jgi:Polysaccharide lyase